MSSVIVDGIDFALDLARGNKSKTVGRSAMSSSVMLTYLGFLMFWCFVWALRTNRHFSSVATIGAIAQCLGLTIMSIKVQGSKSVKGLSSQMLVIRATYDPGRGGLLLSETFGRLVLGCIEAKFCKY